MSRKAKAKAHLLGVFAHRDALLTALHRAAAAPSLEIRDVYSPVADHDLLTLRTAKQSPVRFFTLAGGLCGLAGGLAPCLLTSVIWGRAVFGKPVTSIVPFMVVGFEGTILLGAIGTLLSLLIFAGLPFFEFPTRAYRPEFSRDRFGVWLVCPTHKRDEARSLLEQAGAVEVEDLDRPGDAGGEP